MTYQDLKPSEIPALLPETAPPLLSLLDYWNELRQERPFPTYQEILPENLLPWLGQINLLDVLDPIDFRYRVYGSKLVEVSHYELTGKLLSELTKQQQEVVWNSYCDTARTGHPLVTLVEPTEPQREYIAFSRLILPLGDENGKVTALLVFIQRLNPTELARHRMALPLYYRLT